MAVSPEAPFNWKMLPIGIVSAKGIWKKVSILQVGGSAPAPTTPPVIRIVLLHTEAANKDLCPGSVWKNNPFWELAGSAPSTSQFKFPFIVESFYRSISKSLGVKPIKV